jgi:hypothetical protein
MGLMYHRWLDNQYVEPNFSTAKSVPPTVVDHFLARDYYSGVLGRGVSNRVILNWIRMRAVAALPHLPWREPMALKTPSQIRVVTLACAIAAQVSGICA